MKKLNYKNLILLLLTGLVIIACDAAPPENRVIFFDDQSNVNPGGDENTLLPIPERPNRAVVFDSDYCGCQGGQAITVGACDNICAASGQAASDTAETLFVSVNLTADITEAQFGNLTGWRSLEIEDPNTQLPVATNPSCSMIATDEAGNERTLTDVPRISANNSITVDISELRDDQTYRMRLVENTSGAESTTFQIRKFSQLSLDNITGPLQKVPISRYACGIRNGGSTTVNQVSFNRFHLFFNAETRPDPLRPETIGSFFCHDLGPNAGTSPLPPTNSPLFEETTGAFTLWDRNDPRFFDRDNNQIRDIDEIIEREVNLQGNSLVSAPDLFRPLTWLSAFDDGDIAPGQTTTTNDVQIVNEELGFYMTPFLRGSDQNFRAFCPKQADFFGSNPLFVAMRETIPTDTEALYVAQQVNACDFLLINRSVVERIWFYEENNQRIQPTDETIQGRQVQFFWPANFASPFIQGGHQRKYTIRSTDDITGSCNGSSPTTPATAPDTITIPTAIPPHDKRIGCIPMLSGK